MKLVKTMPRYKCDFCKKKLTKAAMIIHEKICYRNPDRLCDYCDNKGFITEHYDNGMTQEINCPYCSTFDKKMLKEIEDREKGISKGINPESINNLSPEDVPF